MDAQLARELGEIKGALAGLSDRQRDYAENTNDAIGKLAEQIAKQNGRVSANESWRREHVKEHAVEDAHEAGVKEVQAAFSKRDKAVLGALVAIVGPLLSTVAGLIASGAWLR